MRWFLKITFLLLFLVTDTDVWAQDAKAKPNGISAGAVRSILMAQGKTARIDVDGGGDPRIYLKIDGYDYDIFFYGCEPGTKEDRICASYQFFIGFIVPDAFPLSKINNWNKARRYARAYVSKLVSGDMHARIEIDVLQAGTGANPDELFRLMLAKIESYSKEFRTEIGCSEKCKQIEMTQVNTKK
jgi:Putative bacterial sensory transduction regulator